MTESILRLSPNEFLRQVRIAQPIDGLGFYQGGMWLQNPTGRDLYAVLTTKENFTAQDGEKKTFGFDELNAEINRRNYWNDLEIGRFDYSTDILTQFAQMNMESRSDEFDGKAFLPNLSLVFSGIDDSSIVIPYYLCRNKDALAGTFLLAENGFSNLYMASPVSTSDVFMCEENKSGHYTHKDSGQVVRVAYGDFSNGKTGIAEYHKGFKETKFERPESMNVRFCLLAKVGPKF